MDWREVAGEVAQFAPLLGRLLPIPGAGVAGDLIAAAFGVEKKPEAVAQALRSDPLAGAKLARIEADNRAELGRQVIEAETARLSQINKTMRAEASAEHWPQYSWRPFWGFVSGLAFLAVCVLVCVLAYKALLGGRPEALAMIPQFVGSMAALFAIPGAILGVSAWHRGREKIERAKVL